MKDSEFKFDIQLFAPEGDGDDDGDGDNKDDKGKGDKETEFDKLKKAVEEVFSGDDLKVEAAKATMNSILDAYGKKDEAAKRLLRESMDRKHKLRELEKDKDEKEKKALEEKEEFKKLYDTLKPKYEILEKDAIATTDYLEDALNAKVAQLDPKYTELIPDVDIRKKINWIDNFITTMGDKKTGDKKVSVGSSGTGSEKPPTEGDVGAKKKIEEELKAAKNDTELQAVLKKYGRSV